MYTVVTAPYWCYLDLLTLFLPAMGWINPYTVITWHRPVGIGLRLISFTWILLTRLNKKVLIPHLIGVRWKYKIRLLLTWLTQFFSRTKRSVKQGAGVRMCFFNSEEQCCIIATGRNFYKMQLCATARQAYWQPIMTSKASPSVQVNGCLG